MSTVLITGASSGIGFELAKICAKKGHNLILVSRKKTLLEDSIVKSISVEYISKDLSHLEEVNGLCEELSKRNDHVDILINCAGFGDFSLFQDADIEKQEMMIRLNITALTSLTHFVLKRMIERRSGKIMNVASTAAFFPGPYMAVYYATKHYVLAFSEAIAEELQGTGITVTALCPGPTQSNFQDQAAMGNSALVKGRTLPTAEEVAVFGYEAMIKGKRIAIHGFTNRMSVLFTRLLPRSLVAKMVYRLSSPTEKA